MIERQDVVRVFGILQGVILTAVVVGIFLYRKREKDRNEAMHVTLDGVIPRGIQRAPAPEASSQPIKAPELESAFPLWGLETSSHDILGVSPGASKKEVEAAYRKLLKKYHPDRFAHWGAGYQKRAHQVIVLLQKAKDDLIRKSNS